VEAFQPPDIRRDVPRPEGERVSTPLRERPDAPLGTLIFRAGLLPAETIESALEEGVKTGKRLGEILTERGLISEVDLARLLAGQKGLEFVMLREQIVEPSAAALFTEEQARLFRALPYAFEGELPVVAIADPTDDVLIRNIREALGREDARFVVTARSELAEIAADVYSRPLEPAAGPPLDASLDHAHANGHAPETAEPRPETPAAPEPSPFQVPIDEPVGPESETVAEPEQIPDPAPAAASELSPHEHQLSAEPSAASETVPEPPLLEQPIGEPEPVAASEPLRVAEPLTDSQPQAAAETQPQPPAVPSVEPPTPSPEPVAADPVPFPQPVPAPPPAPYPPAAAQPDEPVSESQPESELAPAAAQPNEPVSEPQPESELAPAAAQPNEPVSEPQPESELAPAAAQPNEPVSEPQPESAPPAAPPVEPLSGGTPWRMTIRLTNGERVEAGEFPDEAAAKQEAKAIMMQIAAADQDDWPFVSGRFLKPDTIVSVDIAEHDGDDS
jgi:Type II secretion system (T2SS), protein E, N-terminal domain